MKTTKTKSTKPTKVYVVMEVGFDYDDQYYSSSQNGGGSVNAIFLSKKKAEQQCLDNTVEFLHSQARGKYHSGMSEWLGEDDWMTDNMDSTQS